MAVCSAFSALPPAWKSTPTAPLLYVLEATPPAIAAQRLRNSETRMRARRKLQTHAHAPARPATMKMAT
jgi:hypothetical protein